MTAPGGIGLTRVTVATSQRRIDVALPDHVLVADLLPHLLRHSGSDAAPGDAYGGWALRRTTGAELDPDGDLVSQAVRDGELLHLVPRQMSWPEPAYDDIVEVIASSARRTARSWGTAASRRFGLAAVGVLLVLGAGLLLGSGPPWTLPGVLAAAMAVALTIVGVLLARAGGDAVAGAAVAGYGLLYAALAGALLTAPSGFALKALGAPQVVAASGMLVLFSVLAMVGVVALPQLFTAGIGVGGAGLLAGLVCLAGASSVSAAAVVMTLAVGLQPAYPLLASSLGRIPMPVLPQRPEAILEDAPLPDRGTVFAAVSRAGNLLTGELVAAAVVSAAAAVVLLLGGGGWVGATLAIVGALALLLRGRLFPTVVQRLPLLASASTIIALAGYGWARHGSTGHRVVELVAVLVVAILVLAATVYYGRRTPSPYLGRIADILDVLTIMALIPLACGVIGVFGSVQDMFSSVG